MSVDRISTFSVYQGSISSFLKNQSNLSKLQLQVSSGNKNATFSDVGGDLSRAVNFNSIISSTDSFTTNNGLVVDRMNAYDSVLEQLQSVNTALQQAIVTERSPSAATNPLSQTASNLLASVQSILNTQFDGQYLLSGSATDTPPVGDLQNSNIVSNQGTNNYYKGNDDVATARVSTDFTIKYGITADNPAIKNLISSLNFAIKAGNSTNPNNDPNLTTADDLSNQALTQLASLRSFNGDNMAQINAINSASSSYEIDIKNVLAGIQDTDVTEASVKVSEYQTILQASYQIFAQISKLNLSNFLTNL